MDAMTDDYWHTRFGKHPEDRAGSGKGFGGEAADTLSATNRTCEV